MRADHSGCTDKETIGLRRAERIGISLIEYAPQNEAPIGKLGADIFKQSLVLIELHERQFHVDEVYFIEVGYPFENV